MSLNRFLPLEIRRHQNVQEPEARKLLNYEFLLCDKSHFNSSVCPHPEIGLRMFSMNIFYVNDILVNEDSEVLSNKKWDLLLNLTGLEVCGLSNTPNCFLF